MASSVKGLAHIVVLRANLCGTSDMCVESLAKIQLRYSSYEFVLDLIWLTQSRATMKLNSSWYIAQLSKYMRNNSVSWSPCCEEGSKSTCLCVCVCVCVCHTHTHRQVLKIKKRPHNTHCVLCGLFFILSFVLVKSCPLFTFSADNRIVTVL